MFGIRAWIITQPCRSLPLPTFLPLTLRCLLETHDEICQTGQSPEFRRLPRFSLIRHYIVTYQFSRRRRSFAAQIRVLAIELIIFEG
jgi:hypothetical protein